MRPFDDPRVTARDVAGPPNMEDIPDGALLRRGCSLSGTSSGITVGELQRAAGLVVDGSDGITAAPLSAGEGPSRWAIRARAIGWVYGHVPELREVHMQGRKLDEARAMVEDAIQLCSPTTRTRRADPAADVVGGSRLAPCTPVGSSAVASLWIKR